MKILILTCSTGGGHNTAAQALAKCFQQRGHIVETLDAFDLCSETRAHLVGGTYVNIVNHAPGFFNALYWAGKLISTNKRKSVVYAANLSCRHHLKEHIEAYQPDLIVTTHLFPSETLTYLKRHQQSTAPAIAIMTDYAIIPFWDETEMDGYIVANQESLEDGIRRGCSPDKIWNIGIPVLSIYQDLPIHAPQNSFLILGGSMGHGKLPEFVKNLDTVSQQQAKITVVCGSNEKLYNQLKTTYQNRPTIEPLQYVNNMPELMQTHQIVVSKPGGLSITECATMRHPLVLIDPIPGIEPLNQDYFIKNGMALTGKTSLEQAEVAWGLANNPVACNLIQQNQARHIRHNTAERIVDHVLSFAK